MLSDPPDDAPVPLPPRSPAQIHPKVTNVAYLGFKAGEVYREYRLRVTRGDGTLTEVTIAIPNDAFVTRRLKYQDAPDVCFLKLQRELAAASGEILAPHFTITNDELEDYKKAHTPKAPQRRPKPPVEG